MVMLVQGNFGYSVQVGLQKYQMTVPLLFQNKKKKIYFASQNAGNKLVHTLRTYTIMYIVMKYISVKIYFRY